MTWIDPLGLSCSSYARKLAKNLGNRPTSKHRAHHLVMSNSKDIRMRWLRRKMRNFGIDINDAKNGIWLPEQVKFKLPNDPTTAHYGEGVHGEAYKKFVWENLKNARTKQEFEDGLKKIKSALEAGMKFETIKP